MWQTMILKKDHSNKTWVKVVQLGEALSLVPKPYKQAQKLGRSCMSKTKANICNLRKQQGLTGHIWGYEGLYKNIRGHTGPYGRYGGLGLGGVGGDVGGLDKF